MQSLASIAIDVVFIAAFFYGLSFARPELKEEEVAEPHLETWMPGTGPGMTQS